MTLYSVSAVPELWPSLPLEAWEDTRATLHRWLQIVGKVRMKLSPPINHWWHVTFYVSARGLTTSPIPYRDRVFEIEFDFVDHHLVIRTSNGQSESMVLSAMPVAEFYQRFMIALHSLDLGVDIRRVPVEVEDTTPFDLDFVHAAYDREQVTRFWHALVQVNRVFHRFRSQFIGKCSPVHLWWGAMDLAVTRFSGRVAPKHPSVPGVADSIVLEAYSHEVSSCGFWPGGGAVAEPAFYSYAYPEPPGFRDCPIQPAEGFYSEALGEFILPYEAVRTADDPDKTLLEFLQSTYEAAADCGNWYRQMLERP